MKVEIIMSNLPYVFISVSALSVRFDSVFRVVSMLLEADWFESLENVGNESENRCGVNVCSCLTAGKVTFLEKIKKINKL